MSDVKTYSAFIDGLSRGLILDDRAGVDPPRETRSLPLQAQRVDDGSNPSEIRYEYGLLFGQGDFSHGSGQVFFHGPERDARMFLYSEGFDISEPGKLRHLRTAEEAHFSEDIGRVAVIAGVPFVIDGTDIRRGNGAFPGTWTVEDPHAGEAAVDAHDLCARGDEGFIALGANGLHIRSAAGTCSHFQPDGSTDLDTGDTRIVRFLKDRLIVVGGGGRDIYEVVADSTPASLKPLPTGWEYTDVWENGAFIYASAVSSAARLSRVHAFGLDASGGEIEHRNSSPLPDEQLCYAGAGYLDVIYLGVGKINDLGGKDPVIYRGFPADDGALRIEKLAEEEGTANDFSVGAVATDGESVLFGWSLGENSRYGLEREGIAIHHLARGAFAHHLKKSGLSGAPLPPSDESETRSPLTAASIAGAGADWLTPDNALLSDNAYATQTSAAVPVEEQNTLGARDFDFAVPGGSTISGVEVQVKRKASVASTVTDHSMRLVLAGVASGDTKTISEPWSTTDLTVTYGDSSDLWGLALTVDDVNHVDFGANLRVAISELGAAASVDHLQITVFYHAPITTVPKNPGAVVHRSPEGGEPWANPGNATADDGLTASATLNQSETTNNLTAASFGFALPVDATVTGIEVRAERHQNGTATASDTTVRLVKAGTIVGTNKASAAAWPAAPTVAAYGSSSDLWGTSWTVDDINDEDFGVVLAAQSVGGELEGNQVFVDYLEITVHYIIPLNSKLSPTAASAITDDAALASWLDPTNIFSSDTVYATVTVPGSPGIQDTLRVTNFGFNIPVGSEVNGVEVLVERKASHVDSVRDGTVSLIGGDNKASATNWGTTDAVVTYGGPTDKWGLALATGDVNAAAFGVDLAADFLFDARTASVDHITIKVYWTENPATPGRVTSITVYQGRTLFTVAGAGLFYENLTKYAAEATMVPSVANFNSASEKSWETLELACRGLPDDTSIAVDYTKMHPDEDIWILAGTVDDAHETTHHMRLTDVRSDIFALRFRSTASPDGSSAPEITAFSVRANPSSPTPEHLLRRRYRVLATDRKDTSPPSEEVYYDDPDAALNEIEDLLFETVTLREPGRVWLARVESFETTQIAQPNYDGAAGEVEKNAYTIELVMVGTRESL